MAFFSFITDPINELRAIRLGNKGMGALQAGSYGAAEGLNRRALDIMGRTFGDIEPTAVYAHNLAQVFLAQNRFSEAVPFLLRVLEIRENSFGPGDSHVAEASATLANLYVKLSEHKKAETHFKRALSIYEIQLGTEHPIVAAILSSLAALARSEGNATEADRLFAQAEEILSKHADLQPSDWLHPDARGSAAN